MFVDGPSSGVRRPTASAVRCPSGVRLDPRKSWHGLGPAFLLSQHSTRNFYILSYFFQTSRIHATARISFHESHDKITEHDATMVRDHRLLPRASHGVEWMLIGGSGLSRKHRSHPGCSHCWWRHHRLREDRIYPISRRWMHCRTSGMTSHYMHHHLARI